jgi:hypothetical protein
MITPRTDHLGAAVRQARQRATAAAAASAAAGADPPMTTERLADLLPRDHGLRARFPVARDCARVLDDIENGCEWPFNVGEELDFVRDCAHALSEGDPVIERDLQYEFSDAVKKDVLRPWSLP